MVSGCDVTNPGPVQQQFLADPASQPALVEGAARMVAEALSNVSYTSALVSREMFPGGQTGSLGHDVRTQAGYVEPGSFGGHFGDVVQARFIGEAALDIFADLEVPADPDLVAGANVWTGFAQRLIGENWCEMVVTGADGSPGSLQSSAGAFTAAESNFTAALGSGSTNSNLINAARAGRAQVRVWLGDWSGAASDAGMITDNSWSFDSNMDPLDTETRNQIYFSNSDDPYRAFTMLYTYYGGNNGHAALGPQFMGYYEASGDPRVQLQHAPGTPLYTNAGLQAYGQVIYLNSLRYDGEDADIRLASGAEMRLIEAEAALNTGGDFAGAMATIDALRGSITSDNGGTLGRLTGLPDPTNVATAMSYLMRERGIELWGEGRRWGDQRRWMTGGLGGDQQLADFESTSASSIFTTASVAPEQSICFDIPDSERDANPNVPTVS